mgnify:CR=1 FL=1
MLLVRSPLRISLGGGGTDLPSYYRKKGGYLIASSINKYVYTSIIKPFKSGIYLKYSDYESVKKPLDVKHKLMREILLIYEPKDPYQIEITTLADVPAGTGLGSSGAFTVSVIKAIQMYYSKLSTNELIAQEACHIEIERLRESVGKQDQYSSAIGGLNEYIFNKDDSVEFKRLPISPSSIESLEDSLLMFFTGYTRNASDILESQNNLSLSSDKTMISNLDSIKEMGLIARNLLIKGDIQQYGLLMHDHWMQKVKRSPNICPNNIMKIYNEALDNGAIGGKLVGAGGGGFLLFVAKDRKQLRAKMQSFGLQELRFNFDHMGVQVIH